MRALVLAPYDGTSVMQRANTVANMAAEALMQENYDVDQLSGEECTRKNLPPKTYSVIVFAGHGNTRSLRDSKDMVLFDDKNVEYFKEAVVVTFACEAGAWLGLSAVSKGAKGYIGFTNDLMLPSATKAHNYSSDFMRTYMTVVLALLEGYTLQQCTEEFRAICSEYAFEYDTKEYDEAFGVMYAWMQANSSAVTFSGHPATYLGDEALVVKAQ